MIHATDENALLVDGKSPDIQLANLPVRSAFFKQGHTVTVARWKSPLLLAVAMLACGAVLGQPSARTQREISHLLDFLVRSGCEFTRNGKWYSGVAARAHLQEKYDYLEKRKLLPDSESFIQRAASTSSISGIPYLVRCTGSAPKPSGPWLTEELKRFRTSEPAVAR